MEDTHMHDPRNLDADVRQVLGNKKKLLTRLAELYAEGVGQGGGAHRPDVTIWLKSGASFQGEVAFLDYPGNAPFQGDEDGVVGFAHTGGLAVFPLSSVDVVNVSNSRLSDLP